MNKKPTALAISIILLQLLTWLNIAVFLLFFGAYFFGLAFEPDFLMLSIMISGQLLGAFLGLLFAVLLYFTSNGLMNQKKWARITTVFIGIFMLFGFPIGTVIGVILIYGATKGWPVEVRNATNKTGEPFKNPQADS